jgi:hypothetical protein
MGTHTFGEAGITVILGLGGALVKAGCRCVL